MRESGCEERCVTTGPDRLNQGKIGAGGGPGPSTGNVRRTGGQVHPQPTSGGQGIPHLGGQSNPQSAAIRQRGQSNLQPFSRGQGTLHPGVQSNHQPLSGGQGYS
uniref:Uncharacterized protein n=1 Tax=Sphaerodactylus townsendi TaxID=933632 RepID=A0ACB8F3Z6_9SAUR